MKPTKVCPSCKEEKNRSEFTRRKTGVYESKCKPCSNAHYKARYTRNPLMKERHRIVAQRWVDNNPDRRKQCASAWEARNRSSRNAAYQRYRARKRNAEGYYTVEEWNALIDKHGNRCLCCGRTDLPLTADHVIPLNCGGSNYIDNIQTLCKPCNSRKSDRIIDYRPDVLTTAAVRCEAA